MMYKLTLLMCSLMLSAALFTSCKDDDVVIPEPDPEKNFFTFEGEKYDISKAYGREYDNGPNASVGYSLVLMSDTGSESVMLLFNVHDGTIEGTYSPTTTTGEEPNTFTGARVEIGYNPVTFESGEIYRNMKTPGGEIKISKYGPYYVVDFDVTLDNNENPKGHFTGTIQKQ